MHEGAVGRESHLLRSLTGREHGRVRDNMNRRVPEQGGVHVLFHATPDGRPCEAGMQRREFLSGAPRNLFAILGLFFSFLFLALHDDLIE